MSQIVIYVHPLDRDRRERDIQAHREVIEEPGSGLRVVGKPKVRAVLNRGYIEQPDGSRTVFRVTFEVEKTLAFRT